MNIYRVEVIEDSPLALVYVLYVRAANIQEVRAACALAGLNKGRGSFAVRPAVVISLDQIATAAAEIFADRALEAWFKPVVQQ